MTSVVPVMCRACKRIQPGGATCQAFPEGIPDAIVYDGADHRQPIDGDHGLRFAQAAGAAAGQAFRDWESTFGSIR